MRAVTHPRLSPRSLVLSMHATAVVETDTTARSIVPISGDGCPEWVQLIPAGEFRGVDGRGPWRNKDAAALIAASLEQAGGMDLPIDYGHAMEVDYPGNNAAMASAAEAAGWIVALEARNGEVWGRVEWTAAASEKIKAKAYRGISPVFYHDAQGAVRIIARAGLTNIPNLRIKSLNAQQGEEKHAVTQDQLKALWVAICAVFALPETSTSDAVIARCAAAFEAEGTLSKVASSLSLAATTPTTELLKAVQAAHAKSLTPIDPTKYVPIEQHTAVADQLKAMNAAQADNAVDAAITAGKVTPATREWFKTLAATNRQAFDDFIAKAPVIVAPGAETRETRITGARTLTDAQKSICAQTGVSEADFLKNMETN